MSNVRLVDIPHAGDFDGDYARVPGLDDWLLARQVKSSIERRIRQFAEEGLDICWHCDGEGEVAIGHRGHVDEH